MKKNFVIRKDDPTVYKMAGFSDFTGQFDEAVYEQVTEDAVNPATLRRERIVTEAEKLQAMLTEALAAVADSLTPEELGRIMTAAAGIRVLKELPAPQLTLERAVDGIVDAVGAVPEAAVPFKAALREQAKVMLAEQGAARR